MNTGIIAKRYATALLKFTSANGSGEKVALQAWKIINDPDSVLSGLEPELEKFCALLIKNGRIEDVRLILMIFVRMYCKSVNIKRVKLKTAISAPEVEEKLKESLAAQTGCQIIMDTVCDPSLIGGFILEVDDYRLDASIKRRLEIIRAALVTNNNRLV